MSTEVQRAVQFANPLTGEVLTLGSPDADLAGYLADLREYESVLKEHKSMVNRELLARMDRSAKWTIHAGSLKLTAPSPDPGEEWDGAGLYTALCDLADQDLISTEAVNAAVEIQHVYKVKKAGVNALRKLPGVGQLVDRFCEPAEKARYVRVSRG